MTKLTRREFGRIVGIGSLGLMAGCTTGASPGKSTRKVAVVGGGFGGMAAALRAKALGHDVTLVDKLEVLGGRAQIITKNGFKHDTGPTVITAPFLFEELFNLFDENIDDYIKLVPLEPWYRFYFHDSSTFDYSSSISKTKKD